MTGAKCIFYLESFYKAYETEPTELAINGRQFRIMLPKDLHQFINPHDVMHGFPLWAKIWPASCETMFDIRVLKRILRSDDEEISIFLFRMRLKREG